MPDERGAIRPLGASGVHEILAFIAAWKMGVVVTQ
jgi:hypothetical protein